MDIMLYREAHNNDDNYYFSLDGSQDDEAVNVQYAHLGRCTT